MKTVFSNSELVHVYAQQTQEIGRSGSMFFEGTKIYSFGKHYLLGEFIDSNTIVINNKGYSVTTSKHISLVWEATSHKKQFFKTNCELETVSQTIKQHLNKIPKATKNKGYYLREIFSLFNSHNEYLEYTKTKSNVSKLKEYKEIKKIVQRLETDKDAILFEIAEQNKKRYQKQQEKQKEKIQEFRTYEINHLNNITYSLLRLSLDKKQIETSKGVKIDIKAGYLLYKLIEAGKDIKGYKIDYYTVIGITDNTLRIGCHNIPLQEVKEIGKKLNNLNY